MDTYEEAFGIILHAGNSKSKSMMAIEEARGGNYKDAKALIKEARTELRLAHNSQTDLIQREARGDKVELSIILVHAQDHFTSASIIADQAEEFINLYELLSKVINKEELK